MMISILLLKKLEGVNKHELMYAREFTPLLFVFLTFYKFVLSLINTVFLNDL